MNIALKNQQFQKLIPQTSFYSNENFISISRIDQRKSNTINTMDGMDIVTSEVDTFQEPNGMSQMQLTDLYDDCLIYIFSLLATTTWLMCLQPTLDFMTSVGRFSQKERIGQKFTRFTTTAILRT